MVKFKLAFPYQGHRPGTVIDVPSQDVDALTRSGIGTPEGCEAVLHLGRLPRVIQVPPTPPQRPQGAPEPAARPAEAKAQTLKKRTKAEPAD